MRFSSRHYFEGLDSIARKQVAPELFSGSISSELINK
jgi:hypothetical protein